MNDKELTENIGTIARSGSKAFVRSLSDNPTAGATGGKGEHIIGQFGVGFYSVFMVSDNVEVYSLSADTSNEIGNQMELALTQWPKHKLSNYFVDWLL